MALRKIRTLGDPVLQKVSKPIAEVNEKIKEQLFPPVKEEASDDK